MEKILELKLNSIVRKDKQFWQIRSFMENGNELMCNCVNLEGKKISCKGSQMEMVFSEKQLKKFLSSNPEWINAISFEQDEDAPLVERWIVDAQKTPHSQLMYARIYNRNVVKIDNELTESLEMKFARVLQMT